MEIYFVVLYSSQLACQCHLLYLPVATCTSGGRSGEGGIAIPTHPCFDWTPFSDSATGQIQMRVSCCPIAIEILTRRAGLSKQAAFPMRSYVGFEVLAQTDAGQFLFYRLDGQLFESEILRFLMEEIRGEPTFYPPFPPPFSFFIHSIQVFAYCQISFYLLFFP